MEQFKDKLIGFVIPAKDEAPTLKELYQGISRQCQALGLRYEVIFVDDGSVDDTWSVMQSLADEHPFHVRSVKLRSNIGKARALATGFTYSRADIVFTMDADLQDDPQEIPNFLKKIAEGYDLVSGFKQVRHDPWHKVFPSRVFNAMLSYISGVHLHDHNCGFKCYRAEVTKSLRLYGSLHRMVPVLAAMEGFRVAEIVVLHHPRRFGVSKYGPKRIINGLFDMVTVVLLMNFRESPLHAFGLIALISGIMGLILILLLFGIDASQSVSSLFMMTGAALLATVPCIIAMGFLSELLVSGRHGHRLDVPLSLDTYNVKPVQQPAPATPRDLPASSPEPENNTKRPVRVLLVEDDPISRKMIRLMLKNMDLELIEAIDGEEGLQKLEIDPDIVILDINMPKVDGIGFLSQLRETNHRSQVIVQTASAKVDYAIQAMKLGAFDYLTKPFTRDQLVKAVERARRAQELSSAYENLTLPRI